MGARFRWSTSVIVLAVGVLLSCQPGKVQAHPQLAGPWTTRIPPNGFITFDFATGEYIGNWCWRGPYVMIVSGCPASIGVYELQMISGAQATLGLRDKTSGPGWNVGIVDFANGVINIQNADYKR
jgi:hypothetical protein